MTKVTYDFSYAQGFITANEATVSDIAEKLKDAALYLVNAIWDEKNREELIYNMQCAAIDALDFLNRIYEVRE